LFIYFISIRLPDRYLKPQALAGKPAFASTSAKASVDKKATADKEESLACPSVILRP
jgi:hypothetical protein